MRIFVLTLWATITVYDGCSLTLCCVGVCFFVGDLLSADDQLCAVTVPLYKHFAVATSGEMRDLWLEPGECVSSCSEVLLQANPVPAW